MTWTEVVEDQFLATLPYRIETDRWGHLVMRCVRDFLSDSALADPDTRKLNHDGQDYVG